MTIPPVGNTPGSTPPPDEKIGEGTKPEKIRPDKEVRPTPETPREKVEISPDVLRIRERQAEITRLQVAERAARALADVETRARESVRNANRNNDETRSEAISREIETYTNEMIKAAATATFNGENMLDGREMRFKVEGREITVRTPDAAAYTEDFAREMRTAAENRREPQTTGISKRTREFIAEAPRIRKRLETDVRESIAGAMKESSATQVKDVADAEQLIRNAREANPSTDSQRTAKPRTMEGNAVDLLQ